jgi:phosphoglycolate phosphatase
LRILATGSVIDLLKQTDFTGEQMFSPATALSTIEWRNRLPTRRDISHVIFDFDGTLSWLRHGWPGMMLQVACAQLPPGTCESDPAFRDELLNDILALNGKASFFQMERCGNRIAARFGSKPDPTKMVEEYQQHLEMDLAARVRAVRDRQCEADEFLIHGARSILKQLQSRGVRLIILSGTVQPRVQEEANLLAIEQFFGNHIYGSTADLVASSKRAVIERLMREERIQGEHLLSFGDGPVEIALTKEAGGIAIGVASDEEVNGSGNINLQKRHQLVEADADAVIPDYRDAGILLEHILGPPKT